MNENYCKKERLSEKERFFQWNLLLRTEDFGGMMVEPNTENPPNCTKLFLDMI